MGAAHCDQVYSGRDGKHGCTQNFQRCVVWPVNSDDEYKCHGSYKSNEANDCPFFAFHIKTSFRRCVNGLIEAYFKAPLLQIDYGFR